MKHTLQKIGFFRELPHGDPDGPSLREACAQAPGADDARILAYLRAGHVYIATMGPTTDVLDGATMVPPPHICTDGHLAWPADLVYYVERYHARLPREAVEHMAARAWQVPAAVDLRSLSLR